MVETALTAEISTKIAGGGLLFCVRPGATYGALISIYYCYCYCYCCYYYYYYYY